MSGGGGSPSPYSGPDPLGGHGGAGGGPAGGGGDGSSDENCSALRFRARLRSVDPDEVSLIAESDVLVVAVFSADRPQIGAFRVQRNGQLAQQPVGVLLERVVNLLPCLSVLDFVADVAHLDGGNVTVYVHPAQD